MKAKASPKEYETIEFKTPKAFNTWLKKNHDKADGIWLLIHKKDSGTDSVNRFEALDEALCFGWIDGQAKSVDEKTYVQKYTPRRARSIWSKVNRDNVARLIKEGRMMPAGQLQIDLAKKDGRWDAAYDSPKNAVIPDDFKKLLEKNKKANTFFKTLSKTNSYAIIWRLQTAKKQETRDKRMKAIIEMLEKGETFH